MKIRTVAIEWETDGEAVELPQVVTLDGIEHPDDIADRLSDVYGFLVGNVHYEEIHDARR